MASPTRIAVCSDFNSGNPGHRAAGEALGDAAGALSLELAVDWVPTSTTADYGAACAALSPYDAVLSAGGAYESKQGAIEAIRFARERDWPFFGT